MPTEPTTWRHDAKTDFLLKDSGAREQFPSGAVRDIREGKGRYDLLSPLALHRLAVVMEKGAAKYSAHNWAKGMPIDRCLDSGIRHIYQYLRGLRDEDHLGQGMANLMFATHFDELGHTVQDPWPHLILNPPLPRDVQELINTKTGRAI